MIRIVAMAGVCVLLTLGAQQSPTIRVPVRLVSLPTLVFGVDGRLVPALGAQNFRVFDNDRRQQIRLDTEPLPVSVALVVQANQGVRSYLPFVAKVGSAVDALLVGQTGEAAVVAYNDEVSVRKQFDGGDLRSALTALAPAGKRARMIDAGIRATELLKARPRARSRVLLVIGQSMDDGSQSVMSALEKMAERESVSIYAFELPLLGRAFVTDTFALGGMPHQKGGFEGGVNLVKLIPALRRAQKASQSADPFSILTTATGGTLLHVRKQMELENAISLMGVELRSLYLLNYYPDSTKAGYHAVRVEVDVPGVLIHARPGYWSEP